MPKDYSPAASPINAQRRPQNAMPDEWCSEFLQRARIGSLATRWDEQPFITPTTFWYDPTAHTIYFHSNIVGRIRANADRHAEACFSAFEQGEFLPSNLALEFTVQYESVAAFGKLEVLSDPAEQRRILDGLIAKYFPGMSPGKEYRPITDAELARTSVYALRIESWSGKRNWPAAAKQSDDWPPLPGSAPHDG